MDEDGLTDLIAHALLAHPNLERGSKVVRRSVELGVAQVRAAVDRHAVLPLAAPNFDPTASRSSI